MKRILTVALLAGVMTVAAIEQNLVPNWDFSDKSDPLKGWRYIYPHEQQQYGENQRYIRVTEYSCKRCVEFTLPGKIANNQGAKIETAFIKIEPGATYRFEIDCAAVEMNMELFAEAWAPLPPDRQEKPRANIWPAEGGRPMLVKCGRAHVSHKEKTWKTIRGTYTVDKTVKIGTKDIAPAYLSLKAYVYLNKGKKDEAKAYVANFHLVRVK